MLTLYSFLLLTSLKVGALLYRYKGTGKRGVRKEAVGTNYRHEWKHEISYADLLAIRARMRAIMQPDPHAKNGCYLIRSLYFDNMNDKALREKVDGVNMREKFRIRYYNNDPSVIHLEKKSKLNGLGTKFSANLTAQQAQKIIDLFEGNDERMKKMMDVYRVTGLEQLNANQAANIIRRLEAKK